MTLMVGGSPLRIRPSVSARRRGPPSDAWCYGFTTANSEPHCAGEAGRNPALVRNRRQCSQPGALRVGMPMQWASFTVETRGPGSVSLPSWCGRFRVDGPGSEYTKCPPFKGSMGGEPRATLVASHRDHEQQPGRGAGSSHDRDLLLGDGSFMRCMSGEPTSARRQQGQRSLRRNWRRQVGALVLAATGAVAGTGGRPRPVVWQLTGRGRSDAGVLHHHRGDRGR